jgi:hypothetical protein
MCNPHAVLSGLATSDRNPHLAPFVFMSALA